MEFEKTYNVNGVDIRVSTGKLAKLAQGSVLLQMGGTTLLAAVTIDKKDAEQDFFPLSVEYIEKMYARGAISGGRFQKREGLPSEEAIIKARQVDHSIRSLFPKSFKKPTNVILTVLSYDQENDPEVLAVLGASLAISLTGMPFYGPCSGVVACLDENNKVVINPKVEERKSFKSEFLITGVDDRALSIEGWAKEVEEDLMDKILDESMIVIKELNKLQSDFVKNAAETGQGRSIQSSEEDYSDLPASQELIDAIKKSQYDAIKDSIFQPEKADRNKMIAVIKEKLEAEHIVEGGTVTAMDISNSIEYIAKKILRESILKNDVRRLERGLEEIRPISAEVDILPTVHGSALFNRGLTQSLSIVTLGAKSNEQMIDDMEGESTKTFMHHYNMPPYASGETGRFNYHPGRREIGHGAIGENALKNMIPSTENFPYTIRVVSEIMNSNGSTSMAATCASSMALMAAGVPMKAAVGGIGVGLITDAENEDNYKLLLDIEGIEDFYGDMDFKITGTRDGITAIQYENKLRGVKLSVLKEAIRLSQKGRMQVLDAMDKAIKEPRKELSPTAPIVEIIEIDQENIGGLIGPGGKNIKELIQKADGYAKSSVDVKIEDTGKITITANNKAQLDFVKNTITSMFVMAEVGQVYDGVVDRIMPYGLFINATATVTGLCHVSEMFKERVNADLTKMFKEGDVVKVKVSKVEDGRVNFSMKDVEQSEEIQQKLDNPIISQDNYQQRGMDNRGGDRGNRRFDDRRGGDRGNDRRRY